MKKLILTSSLLIFCAFFQKASAQSATSYEQQLFRISPENFYVGITPSFMRKPDIQDFTYEDLEDYESTMIDLTMTFDILSKWKVVLGAGLLTQSIDASEYVPDVVTDESFWDSYEGVGEAAFILQATGIIPGTRILPNLGISRPIRFKNVHITPSLHFWYSHLRADEVFFARENLSTGEITNDPFVFRYESEGVFLGREFLYPTLGLNVEYKSYIIGLQMTDPIFGVSIPDFGIRLGYKL